VDEPNDFKPENIALFKVGDLVRFVGYYYSPDYVYEEPHAPELGIVTGIMARYFYQPAYKVYWFKKHLVTETVQEYLQLVVIKKHD
jgi:hypothetical protein